MAGLYGRHTKLVKATGFPGFRRWRLIAGLSAANQIRDVETLRRSVGEAEFRMETNDHIEALF